MNDFLHLFDEPESETEKAALKPESVTPSQREALRKVFARLGVGDARGQFALVEELTGQKIHTVQQLEARHALVLIHRLEARANLSGKRATGNSWDDRDEETWIDKL
jgi:phage I-like protein